MDSVAMLVPASMAVSSGFVIVYRNWRTKQLDRNSSSLFGRKKDTRLAVFASHPFKFSFSLYVLAETGKLHLKRSDRCSTLRNYIPNSRLGGTGKRKIRGSKHDCSEDRARKKRTSGALALTTRRGLAPSSGSLPPLWGLPFAPLGRATLADRALPLSRDCSPCPLDYLTGLCRSRLGSADPLSGTDEALRGAAETLPLAETGPGLTPTLPLPEAGLV